MKNATRLFTRFGSLALCASLLSGALGLWTPPAAASPAAAAAAAGAAANGDFNGDGFGDLAVGVPGEDVAFAGFVSVNAGAVNVIYGGFAGLSVTAGPGSQVWTRGNITSPESPGVPEDKFGSALAAGDFNGDGYSDLAVGAPGADHVEFLGGGGIQDAPDAGAVYVIYGSAAGLNGGDDEPRAWTQGSSDLNHDYGWAGDRVEAGDAFGSSLAAGDFNDDGFLDLAIGAPLEDVGQSNSANAGAVSVVFGGASGLAEGAGPGVQFLHQDATGVEGAAETGDQFGFSLAAGNFGEGDGGDTADDLAIGVPFESVQKDGRAVNQAGAVNVIYGSASAGLSATTAVNPDEIWDEDTAGSGALAGNNFGFTLAAGAFSRPRLGVATLDDLAVGVPGADISPNEAFPTGVSDFGCVYALFARSDGTGLSATGRQRWHQNSPSIQDSVEAGDKFGSALAAGDFDGDRIDDLAVGAPLEDLGNVRDAGTVHVIFGAEGGLTAAENQLLAPPAPVGLPVPPGVRFGSSLVARDFGRPGLRTGATDLAVGAPAASALRSLLPRPSFSTFGAVHVFYGERNLGLRTSGVQVWSQASEGVPDNREDGDGFGQTVG
jgi:hypothetical protein